MSKDRTIADIYEKLIEQYEQNPIRAFVMAINQGAEDGVNSFSKEDFSKLLPKSKELTDAKTAIYTNYICLYTHLMNRNLDAEIGQESSIEASRVITTEILKLAAKKLHQCNNRFSEADFFKMLPVRLNAMENIYSKTTSYAGKDNHDPDSTIYQFKLQLFHVFGDNLDPLQELMVDMHTNNTMFMMLINLPEWVKGPIAQLGYKEYASINLVDNDRIDRIKKTLDNLDNRH